MSTNDTLRGLLAESRESLNEGLEDGGALEAEFSKRDRLLIERIDAALAEPVSGGVEIDEQTEFTKWNHEVVGTHVFEGITHKVQRRDNMTVAEEKAARDAWQARAALNGGAVAERDAREVKP